MRRYNAVPSHHVKLHFYGFDSPTEMTCSDRPQKVLNFVLDYPALVDCVSDKEHRERIDPFLGQDSGWEKSDAMVDPTSSIGLSSDEAALRIEI